MLIIKDNKGINVNKFIRKKKIKLSRMISIIHSRNADHRHQIKIQLCITSHKDFKFQEYSDLFWCNSDSRRK